MTGRSSIDCSARISCSTTSNSGESFMCQQGTTSSNNNDNTRSASRRSRKDPHNKPKLTKQERRAKYTQLARDRSTQKRAKAAVRSLVCFQCRKKGHSLAQCPERGSSNTSSNKTPICFQCGSSDHGLANCPEQQQKQSPAAAEGTSHAGIFLPFAVCFVCHEQGHLARDCPQNEKGVYVQGTGGCKVCGSKHHRAKACPEKEATKKAKTPGNDTDDQQDQQYFSDNDDEETGADDAVLARRNHDSSSGMQQQQAVTKKSHSVKKNKPRVVNF